MKVKIQDTMGLSDLVTSKFVFSQKRKYYVFFWIKCLIHTFK